MGILKFFSKTSATLQRLPSGSLTVDRMGNVVTTTIPSSYPQHLLREVASEVLRLFQEAKKAQLTLAELNINFASMRITARELRGGAIIFLSPKTSSSTR